MSHQEWSDQTALPEATTWLLEASAGTGKTFQIASLYLRLVIEHALKVDRILTITFTDAATSELRDRIRARLRQALGWLEGEAPSLAGEAGPEAEIVRRAVEQVGAETARERLTQALLHFDLSAISTIHSFAKRSLDEFSFDSGQERDLELLQDPSQLRERLVDDALASLYAGVDEPVLAGFALAGVHRANLLTVAAKMSAAIEPKLLPPAQEVRSLSEWWRAGAAQIVAQAERSERLLTWWLSAAGRAQIEQLLAHESELCKDEPLKSGKGYKKATNERNLRAALAKIEPALRALGHPQEELADNLLAPAKLYEKVQLHVPAGSAPVPIEQALASAEWAEPIRRLHTYLEESESFWAEFVPLADFAAAVRPRMEAELERRRAISFDTMISRLAERIVEPTVGGRTPAVAGTRAKDGAAASPLARRIRERYSAALVDEFQDTDAAQWQVLRASFHGHRRLFLIGDPKQAIYAFRGADLHVYLQAKALVGADHTRTMRRNFRSDAVAVAANNALWREGSRAFDADDMDYVEVQANHECRLTPNGEGLTLRWLDARDQGESAPGTPIGNQSEARIPERVRRELLAWLHGERGAIDERGSPRTPLPRDFAVLVNSHREGRALRQELARAGIPAVAASKDSLFATEAAAWMLAWLSALATPGDSAAAGSVAVTPLVGWSADTLAWSRHEADQPGAAAAMGRVEPPSWLTLIDRIRASAARYAQRGFAVAFAHDAEELELYPRLLAMPSGERHATDLRHLIELLHTEQRTHQLPAGRLAAWLSAQAQQGHSEHAQRLESDAEAVKIETVHVSKGLEYPIVFLPYAWTTDRRADKGEPRLVRDAGAAALDLWPKGSPQRLERAAEYEAEQRRESLRKLYVALTRAKHRSVVWTGAVGRGSGDLDHTALGALLTRDPEREGFTDLPKLAEGSQPEERGGFERVRERLDALAERSAGAIRWQPEPELEDGPKPRYRAPQTSRSSLLAAEWPAGREVDSPYRSTSFTALARLAARQREASVELAHEHVVRPYVAAEDEALAPGPTASPTGPALGASIALRLGGGTEYGNWVHAVFEQLDFTSGQSLDGEPSAQLLERAAQRSGARPSLEQREELRAALPALLDTPLGSTTDDPRALPAQLRLRDLSRRHRLSELSFSLRLGAGSRYRHDALEPQQSQREGCVDAEGVYRALLVASEPSDRALAPGWFDELARRRRARLPLVPTLSGLLEGAIDLVLRFEDSTGTARYVLADYKSNRVRFEGTERYDHLALTAQMGESDYLLQALIYTVALHRHLRLRLADYSYERHIGGFAYLFVRGMLGAEAPRDPRSGRCHGVYGGRFSAALIEQLDAALLGTTPPTTSEDAAR